MKKKVILFLCILIFVYAAGGTIYYIATREKKDDKPIVTNKDTIKGYDYTLKSNAQIAIVPFMDVLNLTDKARLNTPGTVGNPNWQYRLTRLKRLKDKTELLKKMNKKYKRK